MDESLIIQLVRRAQAGDRDAFGALVAEFEPCVRGVVYRRLRNQAEAAEVTQDVFLRVLRKLPQLREAERFVGWLKRIAIRMSINRAIRRPHERLLTPESFHDLKTSPELPLEGVLRGEQAHQLRDGLSRLRKLDRDTLIAFYFEGRSLKEMSDRFCSPVGTIKRRLHTARARLRAELGELQPA